LLRGPQLRPAALDELLVGLLERIGHADALGRPARPLPVADDVDRRQHLLGEASGLLQDRIRELGGILRVRRTCREAAVVDQLVQNELQLTDRCFIAHLRSPLLLTYMLRRYRPPTSYNACEICPSEQWRTACISSANVLRPAVA